jgi:hypothetical protein
MATDLSLISHTLYTRLGYERVFRLPDTTIEQDDPLFHLICFYMTDSDRRIRGIRTPADLATYQGQHLLSYVYGYIDVSTRTLTLNMLWTHREHTGKKYSVIVLGILMEYVLQHYPGVQWIELDDMSDYQDPERIHRNIYYRLGFKIQQHQQWVNWVPGTQNPTGPERRIHKSQLMDGIYRLLANV